MVKIAWKKNQIVTVAVTVLIILGSAGLSYWIYENYKKTLEEEEKYQNDIAIAKVKRDKIPGLEKQVIKLRENLKAYVKILPDTKEVNEFVNKLSDFASQSGVEVVSLKDDTRSKRQKKQEVFDKESFRIELNGNIYEYLKFISLIENYERFIKISEINIKSGEYDEEMLRSEVIHNITMLVETFIYHGNEGAAAATNIQNYENKRESILDEIIVFKNQIQIERYEYVFDPTIRDPFIDPRNWVSGEDTEGGLDIAEQEEFITDMMDKILEVKGLLNIVQDSTDVPLIRVLEIKKEVAERIIQLNNHINQSIEERWITESVFKTRMDQEIIPQVNELNKNLNYVTEATGITSEELASMRDELKKLYEKGDFEGCIDKYQIIRPQVSDVLKDPTKYNAAANTLVGEIQELYSFANNAKEFNSIELKISGIISQSERSIVIVNGTVLTEGQRLQDNLSIHKINQKEVHFMYKGQIFKIRP